MAVVTPNEDQDSNLTQKESEELLSVFDIYYNRINEVFDWATIANSGIRPTGICNEIYSCFHHIARGLYEYSKTSRDDFSNQVNLAKRHLLRCELDCYKIILNEHLKRFHAIEETLSAISVLDDFEIYVPSGLAKLEELYRIGEKINHFALQARREEAAGHSERAIKCYRICLRLISKHGDLQDAFTKNKTYLMAARREARKLKENKKTMYFNAMTTIIASIIGGIIVLVGQWIFSK